MVLAVIEKCSLCADLIIILSSLILKCSGHVSTTPVFYATLSPNHWNCETPIFKLYTNKYIRAFIIQKSASTAFAPIRFGHGHVFFISW